jgi:hypothetical protein
MDRVQMYRNGMRGVPYIPLAQLGAAERLSSASMRVAARIELDGNPLVNVQGNVYPIDVDGDGEYEYVHYNGYRTLRVYSASGRKLWQIDNPSGRIHRDMMHRDTLAVLDANGDGRQDIAHCWAEDGKKRLVIRRGSDGSVIRRTDLAGGTGSECQIAALRVESRPDPILLVAHSNGSAAACAKQDYIDTWSRTVAFDLNLSRLWDRNTCAAGHYVYPVDANNNGRAEQIMIGHYLYDPQGNRRCAWSSWGEDHADAVGVADLDPSRPGLEAVAIGRSGTRALHLASCAQIWSIPTTTIANPQNMALAKLDPTTSSPTIVIRGRGSVSNGTVFFVSGRGQVVRRVPTNVADYGMPMQNAHFSGASASDDIVYHFGRVYDRNGRLRLGTGWFWGLKGTKVREVSAGYYEHWAPFPIVMDVNRDGRDDIVTWSQSLIVVGQSAG